MKIYYDLDLQNFGAWSGGKDTLNILTYEQINQLEGIFEDVFADNNEVSETTINDMLWFERDLIADWLGFADWEDLEHHNNADEKVWKVYMVSAYVKELLKTCETEDEAEEFCDDHDWEYTDENEFVWELEIEEEWE